MVDIVYRKVGRRYKPVGYSDKWFGFPSDGLWLVQTKPGLKSSECIIKINELESIKPAANLILGYKDKLIEILQKNNNFVNISANDLALQILKDLTK